MKKKIWILLVTALFVFGLSACGKGSDASGEVAAEETSSDLSKQYDEYINAVVEYNNKECENNKRQEDWSKYKVEKEKSNYMFWADENSYYVLISRNYVKSEDNEATNCLAYKVGIENKRVSSSGDDIEDVHKFYVDNITPLYTKEHVQLINTDLDDVAWVSPTITYIDF